MVTRDAAPQQNLRMISCGCTKDCGNACSCRKAGLKCSSVCRHCSGASCDNIPDVAVVDIPEGDDLSDVEMEDDLDDNTSTIHHHPLIGICHPNTSIQIRTNLNRDLPKAPDGRAVNVTDCN
ncbi:hypothetical protein RF55_24476, partial [Lasius niger]